MSTEITETKCPFMQNGGFICIKRKCALYAEDKCSISYLPNIAKEKQEQGNSTEVEDTIEILAVGQTKLIKEFKDMVIAQNNNAAIHNTNIQGIEKHVNEIIEKHNEDTEIYNKDMKKMIDGIKALQSKCETLEKTLATLKKEFAEVEKQVKRKK
jgi:hypothetical protein